MINITQIDMINTTGRGDPIYVCNLNQLDMLSQLEKYPEQIYYILLFTLISFTIYIFYLKNKEGWKDFIIIPYLATITSAFLYLFQTYNINTEAWGKIEPIFWITTILLTAYILKKNWKQIKEGIKK